MELIINSEKKVFDNPLTVEQLLEKQFDLLPAGIAVAVNDQVVPRSSWNTFQLNNGNKILIIKATQGG